VRKTVNTIGFLGGATCLSMIPFQDSHISIIILLSFTNAFSGIAVGGYGVNHADLGPKYTGSIVGFAGGIGMIAAIISPFVAGLILELTGSWFLIFNISTFILVFGGLFYLFFADTKIQFE
jgi:cyanate permease